MNTGGRQEVRIGKESEEGKKTDETDQQADETYREWRHWRHSCCSVLFHGDTNVERLETR